MSPRTAHNGLPVALALIALAALSGCTYVEKNYYYGDLDTGPEAEAEAEAADSGADDADTGSAEEPPTERLFVGEYVVPETGGEPRVSAITLGLQVGADGALQGPLRTVQSAPNDVVYIGYTFNFQLEMNGAIDPAGAAAGSAVNVVPGAELAAESPEPWTGALVAGDDGAVRLEAEGNLPLDYFGTTLSVPFTLGAELQPAG
jgi:hypothetical protein